MTESDGTVAQIRTAASGVTTVVQTLLSPLEGVLSLLV